MVRGGVVSTLTSRTTWRSRPSWSTARAVTVWTPSPSTQRLGPGRRPRGLVDPDLDGRLAGVGPRGDGELGRLVVPAGDAGRGGRDQLDAGRRPGGGRSARRAATASVGAPASRVPRPRHLPGRRASGRRRRGPPRPRRAQQPEPHELVRGAQHRLEELGPGGEAAVRPEDVEEGAAVLARDVRHSGVGARIRAAVGPGEPDPAASAPGAGTCGTARPTRTTPAPGRGRPAATFRRRPVSAARRACRRGAARSRRRPAARSWRRCGPAGPWARAPG